MRYWHGKGSSHEALSNECNLALISDKLPLVWNIKTGKGVCIKKSLKK